MLVQRVDPLGNTTTYSYDAVGRLLSLVDPNGNASGGNPADHTWSFTYDNEDRLLTAQAPAPVSGGAPLVTQYQYDPVGNRTVVIDANGQVDEIPLRRAREALRGRPEPESLDRSERDAQSEDRDDLHVRQPGQPQPDHACPGRC